MPSRSRLNNESGARRDDESLRVIENSSSLSIKFMSGSALKLVRGASSDGQTKLMVKKHLQDTPDRLSTAQSHLNTVCCRSFTADRFSDPYVSDRGFRQGMV